MRTERFFGFMMPQVAMAPWEGQIQTLTAPKSVRIPLSRPNRPPLEPVVDVGDQVKSGQILGATASRTAVHATVTGEVTRIGPIHTPGGREIQGIEIIRSKEDEWVNPHSVENLREASREELIEALANLGFASPWKPEALRDRLEPEDRLPVHTVVIMATDREPDLAVQRRFVSELHSELSDSIQALGTMVADARILLVVPKSSYADAAGQFSGIEILGVTDRYPDNHWRLILARIAGTGNITVPAARRMGILLLTAENLALTGRCLKNGLPRTSKLVTVMGKGLEGPATVETHLGAPIEHLLDQLGTEVAEGDRVLLGGRWQGHAQFDLQAPITLGTDGVTIIPAAEVAHLQENACINCGRCNRVCPVRIQVNLVARLAEFGFGEEAYEGGAHACIECGLCGYVCPSRRPLLQYMRFGVTSHERALAEAEEALRQP